jgi:hypothetical protein
MTFLNAKNAAKHMSGSSIYVDRGEMLAKPIPVSVGKQRKAAKQNALANLTKEITLSNTKYNTKIPDPKGDFDAFQKAVEVDGLFKKLEEEKKLAKRVVPCYSEFIALNQNAIEMCKKMNQTIQSRINAPTETLKTLRTNCLQKLGEIDKAKSEKFQSKINSKDPSAVEISSSALKNIGTIVKKFIPVYDGGNIFESLSEAAKLSQGSINIYLENAIKPTMDDARAKSETLKKGEDSIFKSRKAMHRLLALRMGKANVALNKQRQNLRSSLISLSNLCKAYKELCDDYGK